ncbi:CalU12 [Rhizodiscina lignyota]|uniref:CalU12 n=1 Tax=Rhizodiscina lignyota TaxID=1504668 RepID=A0A9P4IT53_9PEZI|nr:CalU12 [Rhizodiscina lignyota]
MPGPIHIERYPAGASEEYKQARADLLKAEWDLRNQVERVAEMRRALPPGAPMKEYTFIEGPRDLNEDGPFTKTTLADLAADGRSLIIYHMMFGEDAEEACSMCSCAIDSINGAAKHIEQRANLAIIGKGDIRKLRAWARKRGWHNLRILSSLESTFNNDMHLEHPPWMPDFKDVPSMSVFKKEKEGIVRHVYTVNAHFDKENEDQERFPERGGDLFTAVWMILDLIPEGRGDWYAQNDYI